MNRLHGLLSNPVVQGVGMAVAGGFSPLLGLLASPGIRSDRERRELQNEALRQEVRSRGSRLDAQDQLTGLLGRSERVVGPRRAIEGMDGMIDIPGRMEQVPAIATPEGQQELLGLLPQANPEAFSQMATQGLLGQMFPGGDRAEPSFLREMRAAGLDPASGEGREILLDRLRDQGSSDEMLRALQTQMLGLQLEDRRREREERERTEAQQRDAAERSVNRNLRNVSKYAQLNRDLDGTFLGAGVPMPDLRRTSLSGFNAALEAIGMDRRESKEAVAKFDTLRKGLNDLVIETIDRFGDRLTNAKLRLLEDASASMAISPPAIASILAEIAEINLENADADGLSVSDRKAYEEMVQRERAYNSSTLSPSEQRELDQLRREIFGDGT